MKKLLIIILCVVGATAHGQGLNKVLQSIEEHNTTLAAARARTEATSLEALSGVWLANPEVEFAYMWGEGSERRIDVAAKQTFDFPTVYVRKRQMGELSGQLSAAEYRSMRREVLLNATSVCVELIYINAMQRTLEQRVAHARQLAQAWDTKLATGDASIIERNKTQKLLLTVRTQLADLLSQESDALALLTTLNGGIPIAFTADEYPPHSLPASFDGWFDTMAVRNPALEALRIDIERSRRGVQLASATGAPSFALGYKSEAVSRGEQFQGVVASVSIPLWQNKNALKASKASLRAAESAAVDARLTFAHTMRALYEKAAQLNTIVTEFRQAYNALEGLSFLDKALKTGEISLLDYLVELSDNYELIDEQLRLDRELYTTLAELYSFDR